MRMTWWFCSSHQIWFHDLSSLRLGWITSLCIDYVPGLSDLAHTPTKHVEWMEIYPHPVVLSPNNILNPENGVFVFQFPPNLVPQLGCSEARTNRILVYWLCPRLAISCICTHNTCGMDGNTCIPCSSSFNKYHQPNDCMVLLQFSPNLVPQLGWSVAWMDGIPVYWLCFRPVRPCPCTY